MNRTEKVTHSRSEMVAVYGTLCAIPPRNSNSRIFYNKELYYLEKFPNIVRIIKSMMARLVVSLGQTRNRFRSTR
jgi:hypothetical protein